MNTYIVNEDVIKLYKIANNITDWAAYVKTNLEKVVGELKAQGLHCALCSEDTVDAESFKNDDYSSLTRCKGCLKSRA
jgi:hypothetical protein